VTDGRTLHDSKDRAYASHRAVKICIDCQMSLMAAIVDLFVNLYFTINMVVTIIKQQP